MKRKHKNTLTFASILFVVVIVFSVVWIKFVPVQNFTYLRNSTSPITNILCIYPVKVSGDSMSPIFEGGTQTNFDKCFDKSNQEIGTTVLFEDDSTIRIGVIRNIKNDDLLIYQVSNEREPYRLQNILPDEIIAISNIDTSTTAYHPEDQPEIQDPKFDDYFSTVYLGSIPKGTGIENSTVQESAQLNLQENKFCYVVNPIKSIQNVDIVIFQKDSEEILYEKKNISWNPGENSNCDDQEIILNEGYYKFVILVDNALIKRIDFSVVN